MFDSQLWAKIVFVVLVGLATAQFGDTSAGWPGGKLPGKPKIAVRTVQHISDPNFNSGGAVNQAADSSAFSGAGAFQPSVPADNQNSFQPTSNVPQQTPEFNPQLSQPVQNDAVPSGPEVITPWMDALNKANAAAIQKYNSEQAAQALQQAPVQTPPPEIVPQMTPFVPVPQMSPMANNFVSQNTASVPSAEAEVATEWKTYGDDASLYYQFDTSKENETAELLNKQVLVFSRKRTPEIQATEGDQVQQPRSAPFKNPLEAQTVPMTPAQQKPIQYQPFQQPKPSQPQPPIQPSNPTFSIQTLLPQAPVEQVQPVQLPQPVQPAQPGLSIHPGTFIPPVPPSIPKPAISQPTVPQSQPLPIANTTNATDQHEGDFIIIKISRSSLNHIVVVILFVSVFFKFVICKKSQHQHHYHPAESGTSRHLSNSVSKIKGLFNSDKGQNSQDNKLYQQEFQDL